MSRLILITGAAKRIGRHIAIKLAENGYDLALHYGRSAAECEALCTEIEKLGRKAQCFQADLADEEEVAALIPNICQEMGPLSGLINNASVFEWDDMATATAASWHYHMQINLHAPFILSQAFAKQLDTTLAASKGDIINIIDQRVLNLPPTFMSYTVSKSGLWTLTQTMAQALAPKIQVNAIGPGPVLPSKRQSEEDFETHFRNLPLERAVDLNDIADAILMLLKNKSITGQMLAVDCGEHLGWAPASVDNIPNE